MKKHAMTAAISFLLLNMTQAQAAGPTAELTVTGELTAPTCTVAVADDGVYDLGKLAASLIKPTADTTLAAMTKTWTVTCDADTYLNFLPVDNRAASASSLAPTHFGLGMVNGSGKIGYYTAQMSNATVDGAASTLFTAVSSDFTPAATADITIGQHTGWATDVNTLASGKVFSADITVNPVLASTAAMNGPITDDASLDGSMTLNFAYGI